jgi:hypothetical protein
MTDRGLKITSQYYHGELTGIMKERTRFETKRAGKWD